MNLGECIKPGLVITDQKHEFIVSHIDGTKVYIAGDGIPHHFSYFLKLQYIAGSKSSFTTPKGLQDIFTKTTGSSLAPRLYWAA
jgi:hypothetical protein